MPTGASLKLNRARKLIDELIALLRDEPPYVYVVDTDWQQRQRYTQSRRVAANADQAALLCGDAIHNLRAAIDHAYWDRVGPLATTDAERKRVQFPFCRDAPRLPQLVKEKLADRVSPAFEQAIVNLNPVKAPGGNENLCLIDDLDVEDKHKLLIPLGESKALRGADLVRQIPDFPTMFAASTFIMGQNARDFGWGLDPSANVSMSGYAPRELDITIDPFIALPNTAMRPMRAVLEDLFRAAHDAVAIVEMS